MCLKWRSLWTAIQILWSIFYVIGGVIQLTAGIFFSLSVPNLNFYNILCAGIWNIFMGICTGMVACIVLLSPRRQEILLYMSISILAVNFVNFLIMEYRFFVVETLKIPNINSDNTLLNYACIITRIASIIILIIAFLNSQETFCSIQLLERNRNFISKQEHIMDIEYIIPKKQNPKRKTSNFYDAHAQSWVFESDNAGSSRNTSLKHHQDRILTRRIETIPIIQNYSVEENGHITAKSVVQIEDRTYCKTDNSNLKQCHLKSFSRSPSPFIPSASSSQNSINIDPAYNPPIYEYLEKLTEPSIYQSRLDMALCNRDVEKVQYQVPVIKKRTETIEACIEKMQYVCLMAELQRALVSKTDNVPSLDGQSSDSSTTSEKSKCGNYSDNIDSDDDISLQLEAALQLIQDLESPDTPETPQMKTSEDDQN